MDIRISQEKNVTTLTAACEDGSLLGCVVALNDVVQVAHVDPKYQGCGYYSWFLKILKPFMGRLYSSADPSPRAITSWRRAGGLCDITGRWFL